MREQWRLMFSLAEAIIRFQDDDLGHLHEARYVAVEWIKYCS